MFKWAKDLLPLGFLGSEIRVPFLVAQTKIAAAIQGAQSGMAASAEHGDVPFSASCGCFGRLSLNEKKGAPSLSWWDLRKTHPPIMMGFSGEDDRAFV